MCSENPRKWRFTWETQSHSPNLKLFIFDSRTKSSIHCISLEVRLHLPQSQLLVSWIGEDTEKISIRVPIPKLLIDPDSPVSFRALDDHIEVKLVLLLPVDHPIFSNLSLSDDGENNEALDSVKPLKMDSDLKNLSTMEGVHFYCQSCSTRLTRSCIRQFVEMPSVDWREMADNWFGACCCSFGGISEKLVNRFADAYTCARGLCLLNSTSVIICKDDLVASNFADWNGIQRFEPRENFAGRNSLSEEANLDFGSNLRSDASCDNHNEKADVNRTLRSSHLNFYNHGEDIKCKVREEEPNAIGLFYAKPASDLSENVASELGCCNSTHYEQEYVEMSTHEVSKLSLVDQNNSEAVNAMVNRRSFLNGFLGNVFMARSYNLSMDIEWKQFVCPNCSTVLGAYPCADGDLPVDNGVRLLKCYLSTSLPVGRSDDLFRKYTLEKMFANQLIESAKDELSFRTVIRDLTTKSPMLQIVLLNPNSWYCTGSCLDAECGEKSALKLDLHPIIKLLFSDCSNNKGSQLRVLEDWIAKNQAEEVFMLPHLIEELTENIASMKDQLPPSCIFFQGLSLSFLLR
ncbi:uncharacterized protein LOC110609020 [Manihot esculenta]|uniref:Ubiquitin-conjugating enzyme E2C-binding protein n=2 Tax=Manihot esculenta TaxID=3983 RepID=A0A2C9WCI2_MANES|nr:uncharacterized protein LOC110609020 [Manihot esculenta]OAY57451.1 hypothetical protein MANES_02G098000v8 [Manihot esculenta]